MLPINSFASTSNYEDDIYIASDVTLDITSETKIDDNIVEPYAAPVIIGIAIRALLQLGRTELARYLSKKGVSAYCSKFGKSGPKIISNLICK